MIKVIFFTITLLLANVSYSNEFKASEKITSVAGESNSKTKIKYVKVKAIVFKKDSFAKILGRFVRESSVINNRELMVKKTIRSNTHIKNWRRLKQGSVIIVYLDPKFIDPDKLKKYRKKSKKITSRIKKSIKKRIYKTAPRWSTYYMGSLGSFNQENGDVAKVEFKQNSPVTLGLMYTHYPENADFTISSSAYYSYLVGATSNIGLADVEVPAEIGLNLYIEKPLNRASYSLYGGFDFERFNTFNLKGAAVENVLYFDQNQISFLTIGYSKAFKIKKKVFLFKTSLSQSIISSRKIGYSGDDDESSYTGNKLMFFLMNKVNKKFFISSLFKYHQLNGPSRVTSFRYGFGAGYLF